MAQARREDALNLSSLQESKKNHLAGCAAPSPGPSAASLTAGTISHHLGVKYESRNFLRHNHPARGCDLIVCWINN
jgi:hypothetical protein